jgi:hypothetical protein
VAILGVPDILSNQMTLQGSDGTTIHKAKYEKIKYMATPYLDQLFLCIFIARFGMG